MYILPVVSFMAIKGSPPVNENSIIPLSSESESVASIVAIVVNKLMSSVMYRVDISVCM